VGVPRATCDAVLQALASHGLVTRREADGRYVLGPWSIALGEAARLANPVLAAAKVAADQLARAMQTCVAVSVREGSSIRVAEVVDFAPLLALRVRVGQTIPLIPPFGAVFVAWDDDAARWIGAADTKKERERYRRVLAKVRQCGYSVAGSTSGSSDFEAIASLAGSSDEGSRIRDRDALLDEVMHSRYLTADLAEQPDVRVAQISAPVFDPEGKVTASLLVPGPQRLITAVEVGELADRITDAAMDATRHAGGHAPEGFPG
jgi:DNA-binding IclR family transcriptional regulator